MICKRKWWNELKKRNRQGVTIDLDSVSETGQEVEALSGELMQQEERDQLVTRYFQQLGERCREIISQTLSGEHQEKVAVRLGVSYAYLRKKKDRKSTRLNSSH